ncbi:MAG: hypothetical protein DRG83_04485 [Deltaproteobacteria bacterium]|nr:MAG: hypothetical protein DRG83_04485 [Deltaproteobacteria bacterium]
MKLINLTPHPITFPEAGITEAGMILSGIYGYAKMGEEVYVKNLLTKENYIGKVIHVDDLHYAVQIQQKITKPQKRIKRKEVQR